MEVISKCCREGCGVKVSRQSGSVHSAHSVQSALYCKSLLINLMPLAELHSRLKFVTKTQTHNMTLMSGTVLEQLALLCIGSFWTFWQGGFSAQLWFYRRLFYALNLNFTTLHNSLTHFFIYLFGNDTKCFPKIKEDIKEVFAKVRYWSTRHPGLFFFHTQPRP